MKQDSTDRNDIRNTLLANGYTPLPLQSKGIYIKGWSRAEIDADWLAKYARIAKYPNTGIRCDQLAAFDLDVLDQDLADQCEAVVEQHCGETDLCRFGHAPKRLLLYRLDGKPPFKSLRTPNYGGHRCELLCGSGRQFAAYGRHPDGMQYTWEGDSPLDVSLADLPSVSYEQAAGCIDNLTELLADTGLEEHSPGLAFGHAGRVEYDLTDDFECLVDDEIVLWATLRDQLDTEGVFGNIKRESGEFGDSDAVHFMIASGSQQPCIHDFVRDCTHYDQTVSPELADVLPELPDGDMFTPDFVTELLEQWVHIAFDNTVRDVDDPLRAYPLAHFKAAHQHWQIEVPAAGGKTKLIPAIDGWLKSSDAMRAKYAALRPDSDEILIEDKPGRYVFNTYAPPLHGKPNGSTAIVHDFLKHLLPKRDELELFLDWHALKVAHPGWRMHGLVTVTPAYGTGRGTWFQILEKLFGSMYVRRIELTDLTGTGSQASFNEFLADSLIVYVPEALEEKEDQHRWTARHVAYERLKTIVELQAGPMYIKRKYGRNTVETVFASLLISSNYTDALAIEPGDRRIVVLDNTEERLPEGHPIHDWLEDPRNIASLQAELTLRAADARERYNPFGMPPMTPAKERMIESGQSDTDRAFDYMLDTAAGDLVTPAQWAAYAHQARITWQLDLPTAELLQRALNAVMQKRGRRCEALPKSGIKIDGKPQRPWIIRNFDAWKGSTDLAAIRAEIAKNGPTAGNVTPFTDNKLSD